MSILNEEDYTIYGDKVRLYGWLRKDELDHILQSIRLLDIIENEIRYLPDDKMDNSFKKKYLQKLLNKSKEKK